MPFIMSAVVCGDDQQRLIAQSSFIQCGQQGTEGFICTKDHAQLFGGKPAMYMTHVIGGGEVDEEQVEIHREICQQSIHHHLVAVIDPHECIQAGGRCHLL